MINKCLFLDRDGVINEPIIMNNRPFAPLKLKEFKIYNNISNTLKYLKSINYLLIIITNQSELSKGNLDQVTLKICIERFANY